MAIARPQVRPQRYPQVFSPRDANLDRLSLMEQVTALEQASREDGHLTWPQMQRLARLYAAVHGDTFEQQIARQDLVLQPEEAW